MQVGLSVAVFPWEYIPQGVVVPKGAERWKIRYRHRLRRQGSFLETLAMVVEPQAEMVFSLAAVRLPQ